ncbi:hypothetical protein HN51_011893, partial [Arachis hypogaea]
GGRRALLTVLRFCFSSLLNRQSSLLLTDHRCFRLCLLSSRSTWQPFLSLELGLTLLGDL